MHPGDTSTNDSAIYQYLSRNGNVQSIPALFSSISLVGERASKNKGRIERFSSTRIIVQYYVYLSSLLSLLVVLESNSNIHNLLQTLGPT
jgi:hypothetical protein